MKIEIVTHCYRYPTLLRYQLSSLVLWAPADVDVMMTVFYTEEDRETERVLEWFGKERVPRVRWNWRKQPVLELCKRAIGRNLAALATHADWVWFCDADYWFTSECWNALTKMERVDAVLVFPRIVNTHRAHHFGDVCIDRAANMCGTVMVDVSEFEPSRMHMAIGGIQITQGDFCRARGYLRDSRRSQRPRARPVFERCREDVTFRKQCGTRGLAIDLPGVYRIRHTRAGRDTPGLVL